MRTLTLMLLALAACNSSQAVSASQFDQTCKTAADCVWVLELSVHGSQCIYHCPSAFTAINKGSQAAFDAAVQQASAHCTSVAQPGCIAPPELACVAGVCGATAADASKD